jgi:RNA polymerase sigma factor (sigma-70 family)
LESNVKVQIIEHYLKHRMVLKSFLIVRLRDGQIAEDLLQEMYLKLDRANFDRPIENQMAFLYRVANNLVLDYRKSKVRRKTRDDKWSRSQTTLLGNEAVNDQVEVEVVIDAKRRLKLVGKAISKLPPKCQIIFKACKIQGMTYREAAEHHNISIGTVEKHVSKALKFLIKYIEEDKNEN